MPAEPNNARLTTSARTPKLKLGQFLVLAAITLTAPAGDSLLARGMRQVGPVDLHHLGLLLHALANPYVDAGVLLLAGFFSSYTAALSWADLSFVVPATALNYVLIALLGHFWMHEHLSLSRCVGIVMIMCAVGFVAGGPARTEHPALDRMDAGGAR